MIPISDTAPRASPPTIVLLLITINVVVFLRMRDLPHRELNRVILKYALVPLRYSDPEAARATGLNPDDWWPLLTNTFLHGGWLHLILNMWTLWILGPAMEARCGRMGFLVLYVAGAVVASFTHLVANWHSEIPALRASGAIAAVIAAYAVIYPRQRILLLVPILIFPLFIPVSALVFGFGWFALQVLQGTSGLFAPDMAGGIAWWAHIGGFGFGAVFAIFVCGSDLGRSVTARRWAMPARGRMMRTRGPWDISSIAGYDAKLSITLEEMTWSSATTTGRCPSDREGRDGLAIRRGGGTARTEHRPAADPCSTRNGMRNGRRGQH